MDQFTLILGLVASIYGLLHLWKFKTPTFLNKYYKCIKIYYL